ncbi:hypothetical protein Tco_0007344 [Tanacetum coccineum]
MRNREDFSYIECMLPLVYQLMAVKKTSFPEMECSGSIVVSIPDVVKGKSKKIGDTSRMVASVSILEESIRNKGTSPSKQNSQSSSTTFIYMTDYTNVFLDFLLHSPLRVSEDKRAMLCLDFKDLCLRQNLLEYMGVSRGMMLPRVRNHHGGKCVHPGLS